MTPTPSTPLLTMARDGSRTRITDPIRSTTNDKSTLNRRRPPSRLRGDDVHLRKHQPSTQSLSAQHRKTPRIWQLSKGVSRETLQIPPMANRQRAATAASSRPESRRPRAYPRTETTTRSPIIAYNIKGPFAKAPQIPPITIRKSAVIRSQPQCTVNTRAHGPPQ